MDPETTYDAVASVGVKGGKIVAITMEKISGKETIDATGLVVAPGFIDTHFYSIGCDCSLHFARNSSHALPRDLLLPGAQKDLKGSMKNGKNCKT